MIIRSQLILSEAVSLAEDTVLIQTTDKPILRGYSQHGCDYICGRCRQMVLVEQACEGEILDVIIKCFSCGGLSASPRRPCGIPLPGQRIVPLPGEHSMRVTIENYIGAVIVGKRSNDDWIKESGINHGEDTKSCSDSLDLKAMVEEARTLLPGIFDELLERERRGQKSRTPPKNRHRLMALATEILQCAESFGNSNPRINSTAVGEFNMAVDLFKRWKNDPIWPQLLSSLRNPTDYPHAIIALVVASHLNDIGNGAGFIATSQQGKRNADIRIVVSALKSAALEVKAPLLLQKQNRHLDFNLAGKIVRKAIREADTRKGGQLDPQTPGILLIGGFHLSDEEMAHLEKASRELLENDVPHRRHVSAIVVLTIRVIVEGTDRGQTTINTTIKPVISYGVAVNPHYDGSISLLFPSQPQA